MLRAVLEDFLDRASERELDVPLMALLWAEGFEDVHFTHGQAEYGKDFIGKKDQGAGPTQWAFQSKAGDIKQGTWRNEIQGQLLEAMTNGLSHPSFNRTLPRQVVLVLSGELKGNAATAAQAFRDDLSGKLPGVLPLEVWDREDLLRKFLAHPPGLHGALLPSDFAGHGAFFGCYGRALDGRLSADEIELHSRSWLKADGTPEHLMRVALEAEVLATTCGDRGHIYEAAHARLALHRFLLWLHYSEKSAPDGLKQALSMSRAAIARTARQFMDQVSAVGHSHGLLGALDQPDPVQYLVGCSRAIEMGSIAYFLGDEDQREAARLYLDEVLKEPGAVRPLSDRYAAPLTWALLLKAARGDDVAPLIEKAMVWTCDRYESGLGLASVDSGPQQEATMVFGEAFQVFESLRRHDSMLSTALTDLSVFATPELFEDMVNDILAVRITPEYFQAQNSEGQFRVDAEDVLHYVNVAFDEGEPDFASADWGDHIRAEPEQLAVGELDARDAVLITLLLRDRYFPRLWPRVLATVSEGEAENTERDEGEAEERELGEGEEEEFPDE